MRTFTALLAAAALGLPAAPAARGADADPKAAEMLDAATPEQLLIAVQASDPALRAMAAERLGRHRAPGVYEALAKALGDPHRSVRMAAATGLGRLRDRRAVQALGALLTDADPGVRGRAVDALAALGDFRAAEAVATVLDDPEPEVRRRAMVALGVLGDPAGAEAARKALADPAQRMDAIRTIVRLKDRLAVKPLCEVLLADPKAEVRRAAAEALRELASPEAADALRKAMTDGSPLVRLEAAKALGLLAQRGEVSGEALEDLLDRLARDLKGGDVAARRSAAWTLGRVGTDRALDLLVGAMNDPEPPVRWSVMEALGALGDLRAVPPLIDFLERQIKAEGPNRREIYFSFFVARQLETITGQMLSDDVKAWRAWWAERQKRRASEEKEI